MVMWAIADLSKEVSIPSVLADVIDGMDDEKDHNFLETFLVAHPLLGVEVLIGEAIKVSSS